MVTSALVTNDAESIVGVVLLFEPVLAEVFPVPGKGLSVNVLKWLTNQFWSRRSQAMARYRCGMSKATRNDSEGAIGDYSKAIELAEAWPDIEAMVRFNRALAYFPWSVVTAE